MTRQQAREVRPRTENNHARRIHTDTTQKAEILRLRLGLAGYKVRTGQTTVPLDELVRKPLPGIGASAAGRDDEAEADRHSPERGAADLLCLARGSSE